MQANSYIEQPGLSGRSDILSKNIEKYGLTNATNFINTSIKKPSQSQPELNGPERGLTGLDYSRYAPVATNMITGISDILQKPEVVKYGRINPEMNRSHMDYQPVDTE